MKYCYDYLQVLDSARKRLANVISERSRVLDLICHALPETGHLSASARGYRRRGHQGSRPVRSADGGRESGMGPGIQWLYDLFDHSYKKKMISLYRPYIIKICMDYHQIIINWIKLVHHMVTCMYTVFYKFFQNNICNF